ncbi:SMC-Scp complex subunit ScpB [Aminomonas paucivorans]|uniref:Condensin subunit ScpB n=1 Tax=Aminomonas paucivorans DSM 12260 TaxID=584708 RepID=E3CYA0_9BACT|nr:SMC-Scp complex subunit ScpB [Aminomonas paucivorans]EFQ23633.1 condensin subunit ScpB [Aminomonas paucivorans DSM 12260]
MRISPSASAEPLGLVDRQVEALLFVSSTPLEVGELAGFLGLSASAIRQSLERLKDHYATGHGLVLLGLAGGWQLATAPDLGDLVANFRDTAQSQRVRLSRAAVETLAAVAYHQPVTRAEVEELRGVRCDRVLETLLRHGLVRVAGRRKSTGTPLLYRTTSRFLELFGLGGLGELPSLEDLQDVLPPEAGGETDPSEEESP